MDHFALMKQHLIEICLSCGYAVWAKMVPAFFIGVLSFFFGVDNFEILLSLTVLIVFDLMTGAWAARKNGDAIQSRKVWKTANKMGAYGIMLSAAWMTETIVPGAFFIFGTTASFLALTELVSIVENVGKMGYQVPQKLLKELRRETKKK